MTVSTLNSEVVKGWVDVEVLKRCLPKSSSVDRLPCLFRRVLDQSPQKDKIDTCDSNDSNLQVLTTINGLYGTEKDENPGNEQDKERGVYE